MELKHSIDISAVHRQAIQLRHLTDAYMVRLAVALHLLIALFELVRVLDFGPLRGIVFDDDPEVGICRVLGHRIYVVCEIFLRRCVGHELFAGLENHVVFARPGVLLVVDMDIADCGQVDLALRECQEVVVVVSTGETFQQLEAVLHLVAGGWLPPGYDVGAVKRLGNESSDIHAGPAV